ncbi:MAG: DUF4013 domain-containing protein [Acidobacteria bacterium]|nr:DUF4013 domain-containing protein [Acidobacteriota bacterium]
MWQVEANGQTFDAPFAELTQWIIEGSVLRIDRVRKGNLRWIEAGKVPALVEFFNAKDKNAPPPPVITATRTEVLGVAEEANSFINATPPSTAPLPTGDVCAMHADAAAAFVCETCSNAFCKACPNSYGGTVKICPFCGAMCKSLAAVEKEKVQTTRHAGAMAEGFGFSDFGRAVAYPFRFKFSLFFGALFFMIFTLGQSAGGFGGVFMIAGSLMCFMLANTLTFGVLAHTVDNFAQGKLDENFMPSFDDFSLWDDVVHPFFLSVGAYISSFLPFIAVLLVGIFFIAGSIRDSVSPPPISANQAQQLKELVNQTKQSQQDRVNSINNGQVPVAGPSNLTAPGEDQFQKLNDQMLEQRRSQLESTLGKSPETLQKEKQGYIRSVLGFGALFLALLAITLLWGFFSFPAACAVAGYTRSFTATINPSVVLDTIKHLGSAYALVLIMTFLLGVASAIVTGTLNLVLSPFDLPTLGNIPAKALGSFVTFYFSVVFSCILGYAIYKRSDKLQLFR